MHEPWTSQIVSLFLMLDRHGALPDAGGVFDQSAWLVDALELTRAAVDRLRDEKPKRTARQRRPHGTDPR